MGRHVDPCPQCGLKLARCVCGKPGIPIGPIPWKARALAAEAEAELWQQRYDDAIQGQGGLKAEVERLRAACREYEDALAEAWTDEQFSEVKAQRGAALALLRLLEWSDGSWRCCPCDDGSAKGCVYPKHAPDCELAALLKGREEVSDG